MPTKYLWPILIIAGVAVFFLYDNALTWILGLVGLGAASEGMKAKKARNEADTHTQVSDGLQEEVADQIMSASVIDDEVREIFAEEKDDTPINQVVNRASKPRS